MSLMKLFLCVNALHLVFAKGADTRVECSPKLMKVMVPLDGSRKTYLDQMKDYKPCAPEMENGMAMYHFNLDDPFKCGVTRVLNKLTGKKTFYHNIVIEDSAGGRETVTVRCSAFPEHPHAIDKRQAETEPLPLDFHEPDVVTITRVEEWHAPEPQLGVAVRQNGKQVSGEISVSPGTPLSMEIFLDNSSAPVYGLLANYMHVTDTKSQSETIILNGCSLDSYLFDNFLTEDGDVLKAQFRAFKFPDTSYVQFMGIVTVCLDKCQGVQCNNGVTGYGRRRRSVATSHEGNLYEVALTTFIRVESDQEGEDVLEMLKKFKVGNQMLGDKDGTPAAVAEHTPGRRPEPVAGAHTLTPNAIAVFALVILFFNK